MKLSKKLIRTLAATADNTIEPILFGASHGLAIAPRTEVGFVASMTLTAIPAVSKMWIPLLRSIGINLSFKGVFCHMAPQIQYSGSVVGCELADLLVVIDINKNSATPIRRASLIQTKMACNCGEVSLSGASSQIQKVLYQQWPLFRFKSSVYPQKQFDFHKGGAAITCGTFGVINSRSKIFVPSWTQHKAMPTPKSIIGASTFGTFLAEMLGGINSGYWRVATKSLNTDWTEAVDWLLKITLPRTFGHKATLGTTRHPRQVETEIRLSLQSVTSIQKYSGRSLQVLSPFLDQKIFQGEKENGINLLYFELENTQP